MSSNHKTLYGAFACVYIRFDGDLEQLADTLALALNLKSFDVEASEEPPYEKIGSAESLGWEAWLQVDSGNPPYNYRLRIETENSFRESFEGRMHDLSPWLARFLMAVGDIEAVPEVPTPRQ